jgi:hypothetical protein
MIVVVSDHYSGDVGMLGATWQTSSRTTLGFDAVANKPSIELVSLPMIFVRLNRPHDSRGRRDQVRWRVLR